MCKTRSKYLNTIRSWAEGRRILRKSDIESLNFLEQTANRNAVAAGEVSEEVRNMSLLTEGRSILFKQRKSQCLEWNRTLEIMMGIYFRLWLAKEFEFLKFYRSSFGSRSAIFSLSEEVGYFCVRQLQLPRLRYCFS